MDETHTMYKYWLIPALVILAGLATLVVHAILRRQGKPSSGFGVAIIVMMCWVVGLVLILRQLKG